MLPVCCMDALKLTGMGGYLNATHPMAVRNARSLRSGVIIVWPLLSAVQLAIDAQLSKDEGEELKKL